MVIKLLMASIESTIAFVVSAAIVTGAVIVIEYCRYKKKRDLRRFVLSEQGDDFNYE